jgi:hypothetical protein
MTRLRRVGVVLKEEAVVLGTNLPINKEDNV